MVRRGRRTLGATLCALPRPRLLPDFGKCQSNICRSHAISQSQSTTRAGERLHGTATRLRPDMWEAGNGGRGEEDHVRHRQLFLDPSADTHAEIDIRPAGVHVGRTTL